MGHARFVIVGFVLTLSVVTPAPAAAATVTVEAPAADSHVYNQDPDGNYGSVGTVTVQYYWQYSYPSRYRRVFCRWDLPALPPGAVVTRAEAKFLTRNMSLWPYYNTPDVQCRRVTEAWQENAITWNNQPSRGDVESTTRMEWEKTWYIFDVTGMVKDWYANPQTNFGLALNVQFDLDDPYSDYWATY